jgi:hypothetical protein
MRRTMITVLLVAGLLAASAIGSQSLAQNLLANPGFESLGGSYDGWFTFGSGPNISTAADDNIMRTGDAASKIYGEFSLCDIGGSTFDVGGYGQTFTPVAGQVYEFGGYSFVSSEDAIPGTNNCDFNRCVMKVVFFNAAVGGSEISGNEIVIGDYSTTPLDEWNGFSVSAIAPPGALRGEALILFLQPACDTGSVYIDDCFLFEQTPEAAPNVLANPSFDTDLLGWEYFGNAYYENRSWAVRTPTGCAKLFGTYVEGSSSGMYQMFPASESDIWIFGINTLTTCRENPIEGANDNSILAKLIFYDSDTLVIDEVASTVLDASSPMGTWVHFDMTGVAPTNTAYVRSYILFEQPTLGDGAAFVDDVSLYKFDTATYAEPMPEAKGFTLRQNVPNPFNPSTRIDFELEKAGSVSLSVYDVSGRLVANLFSGHLGEGAHEVTWNGKTNNGTTAATGVYLYVLKTETGMDSKRMVLLR